MQLIGWVIALGTVAFPPLFVHAYFQYRRGNRERDGFIRSIGLGSVGFSVLVGQASTRWFGTPIDDGLAVLSIISLLVGVYAMYVGYIRGNPGEKATDRAK